MPDNRENKILIDSTKPYYQYRNIITNTKQLAFGCSHTWGIGVDANETWPYLLDSMNFGVRGCSSDLIARIMPDILQQHNPEVVYILWPEWTRFEYVDGEGRICQILSSSPNRIAFMESHNDEWLANNFKKQVQLVKQLCNNKNIKLVDITLYDLIPYMDQIDKWPASRLGHHYAASWHKQVADILRNALVNNIQHPLNCE